MSVTLSGQAHVSMSRSQKHEVATRGKQTAKDFTSKSNAIYQTIHRAVVVECYRNIELGVICIAMVIQVGPPDDTTKG